MKPAALRPIAVATFIAVLAGFFTPPVLGEEWRSSLYPEKWDPSVTDAEGRFLHDFSYAGYRNGAAIPQVKGRTFDVKRSGADAMGVKDSTAAFQSAVDEAAKSGGGVVLVPAGTYRIDGVLEVRGSKVVLRGEGAGKSKLRFTRAEGMDGKAHLTIAGEIRHGSQTPLAEDAKARSCSAVLESAGGLKAGDEVAVGMVNSEEFRTDHGMKDYWAFSSGKWRPLFRRTVTAVDARKKTVSFDVPLRYGLKTRWAAALCAETGQIRECGIEKIGVSNAAAYKAAWKTNQVAVIELSGCADCWVSEVESFASEAADAKGAHLLSCGIRVRDSKRITISRCSMSKPGHRGGGGNGYLFEIRTSNEVLTADCIGLNGRHNFIQNWDFGCSGCVWLRVRSSGSIAFLNVKIPIGLPAASEYHHALAMANLVDSCVIEDGWNAVNRGSESSGAGHTATQCVFWNSTGKGIIQSRQFGWGYVIGTGPDLKVFTGIEGNRAAGTEPEDFAEGLGKGADLTPKSLYEDQHSRRRK